MKRLPGTPDFAGSVLRVPDGGREPLCRGECRSLDNMAGRHENPFAGDRVLARQVGPGAPHCLSEGFPGSRSLAGRTEDAAVSRHALRSVACPARGTQLASDRLDFRPSVLEFLSGHTLLGDTPDGVLAVVKARSRPRISPGAEAMMPGVTQTRSLDHRDPETVADLEVSGVTSKATRGGRTSSRWRRRVLRRRSPPDREYRINGSGLRRPAQETRFGCCRGAPVSHFRHFVNDRHLRWPPGGCMRGECLSRRPDTA